MKKSKLLMLLSLLCVMPGCNKEEPTTEPNANIEPEISVHSGDHDFLTGWDKNETHHWHYCGEPGCEEMSSRATHTFEWAVTKEPSFEAVGIKSYKCTTCGYVKEKQDIAKLTHSYNTQSWSHNTSHHWRECLDEGYEGIIFGSDIEEHNIVSGSPEVEPTYTEAGHTASGVCSVCGATINPLEIPVLNETNYVKEVSKNSNILTEVWTLKDADVIGRDQYVVTKKFEYGWVVVDDHSGKEIVTTNYNYYDFNNAFPGIQISINGKTVTINVTELGGYTLNDVSIIFPTSTKNTVKDVKYVITGQPLTINAPEGLNEPGLLFSCSTSTDYMSTVIIDNNLTINYSSGYTTDSNNSGLSASKITVNSAAKLTINGFKNGINASYTPININGALDITAKNLAIIASSSSKNRTINIASGSSVYFNDVIQSVMTRTDTNTLRDSNVKHLQVIPVQ